MKSLAPIFALLAFLAFSAAPTPAAAQGCGIGNNNCIAPTPTTAPCDNSNRIATTAFIALCGAGAPSAFIDQLCNVNNDFLLRTAGVWGCGPAVGAFGRVLTDQGAGSAPAYAYPGPITPQGRCTLTSGAPVMTTDVAAAATVFYTQAIGQFAPIFDGTGFVNRNVGGELSQSTTDTTKSPAAVVNVSNYDVFVWNDSGTARATRGPPWTSDTARGSGAGTTELQFLGGIATNKNAITNGPGANLGTYVCTFRSNGTATVDVKFGGSGVGGNPAIMGIWNLYNKVIYRPFVADSTASWNYTSSTVRAVDASTTNRISFISGLATDGLFASYGAQVTHAAVAGSFASWGICLDSTTTYIGRVSSTNAAAVANIFFNFGKALTVAPQLGFHFLQACENSDNVNAVSFNAGLTGLEAEILW